MRICPECGSMMGYDPKTGSMECPVCHPDASTERWTCEAGKYVCDMDCARECKEVE